MRRGFYTLFTTLVITLFSVNVFAASPYCGEAGGNYLRHLGLPDAVFDNSEIWFTAETEDASAGTVIFDFKPKASGTLSGVSIHSGATTDVLINTATEYKARLTFTGLSEGSDLPINDIGWSLNGNWVVRPGSEGLQTIKLGDACDANPPVWDADPVLSCGGTTAFAVSVASHDEDSKVAGYKVTINGCTVNVSITPAQSHSGVISVPLSSCGITLSTSSNYTATIQPVDQGGNEGASKTVTGIKVFSTPVTISSVSCGTATAHSMELRPVVSGGTPATYQVSYGSIIKQIAASGGTVTVDGLEPLTTYSFTLRPVDGCGNVASSSASTSCQTLFEPHAGADTPTELIETEFDVTSTGNCGTSIAGGTNFSQHGATGAYSHSLDEVDIVGNFVLSKSFKESYSNGYFHEDGVTDDQTQYAIVSNPKVLNGTYKRITDGKNRIVLALGKDPNGNPQTLFQFKRTHLAAGAAKVSFTIDDLVDGTTCPQTNLNMFRGLTIVVYKNGNPVENSYPNIPIGTSYNFSWSGTVSDGDFITVEVKARYLATCTALAISDLRVYGCLNKAIETTTGSDVFCENKDVTLMATGTTATNFKWESSPDNTNWTTIPGATGAKIDVKAVLGNTYYRYTEVGTGVQSKVFALLGQVCCTYLDEQKTIWKETFGNGTGRWQNSNVRNHTFKASGKIDDTYYAVVSNSSDANQELDWPGGKTDHTGDTNGGFLVINVNNTISPPVLIYSQTITPADGFCEATYYNLSLFASNISPAGLPSSFSFEVVDSSTGKMLGKGTTGDINDFGMANWLNYGTSFSPENSTSVKINIYNTGAAGGGNDVVLDDISVSVCNAKVDLYADYPKTDINTACGKNVNLQAVVDGKMDTYFGTENPYFLWTKSIDGGATWNIVETASGYGNKVNTTPAIQGEVAIYKVIISAEETNARKVFNNDPIGGCVIYTITNEAKVECVGCDLPEVSLSPGEEMCANSTVIPTITATVSAGEVEKYIWKAKRAGETSYTTVATHASTATTDTYTPSAMPTVTTVYQVTAESPDGCSDTKEMTVTVNEPPVAPEVEDVSECYDENGFYTFKATPTGTNTLIWYDVASGGTPLTSAPKVSLGTPGPYTYYVSQTDGKCEGPRAAVTLTVEDPVGTPTVKYRTACLNGTQIEFDATAPTGYTLVWYKTMDATLPETVKPAVDMSEAGEQTVYASIKKASAPFCEGERVAVSVMIYETILTVTTQPSDVCVPNKVDLTTAVTSPSASQTTGTFAYYASDKVTPVTDPTSVDDGTYYIQLTDHGCPSDPVSLIAVVKNCDNLTLSASAGSTVCQGEDVTVTFTLKNVAGKPATGVDVTVDESLLSASGVIKSTNASSGTTYTSGGVWSVGNTIDMIDTPVTLEFTIEADDNFDIDAFISEVNTVTFTKSEAKALTDKTYYAKTSITAKPYADAPDVLDYNECAATTATTFRLSERVIANKEKLTWYEKNTTGGYDEIEDLLIDAQQPQKVVYYVSNQTASTCESELKELNIEVKENARFTGSPATTCSADLKKYSVEVQVSDGTVTSDYAGATISNVGNVWTIADIDKAYDVKLTVEKDGCGSLITVLAPKCDCPVMDAPVPVKNVYEYCEGDPVPQIAVTIASDPNLVVNWYESETSETILATGDTYSPSDQGTYYAEAYNTLTECKSGRVAVQVVENKNPEPSIEASNMLLTCDVTSITLSAIPETGVSYLWNDASSTTSREITVTTPSDYEVEVTDNTTGCKGVATVSIKENITTPTVSLSTTDGKTEIDCAVSSIEITANATPVGEVSYRWNTGETTSSVTATDASQFSVEVKHNVSGCTATDNVEIKKNPNLPSVTLKASKVQFTCDTLLITLSANIENATGNVSYKWSDGSSGTTLDITTADRYSLEITDELPCSATANIYVGEDMNVPAVNITAPTTVLTCGVNSIKLTATEGFASYVWTNSLGGVVTPQPGDAVNECTISTDDKYIVTAKSGKTGCLTSDEKTITKNTEAPSVTASAVGGITVLDCNNSSITLRADAQNCTYSWADPSGSEMSDASEVSVSTEGLYTVTVTDVDTKCQNTDGVEIRSDTEKPVVTIDASPSEMLTCKDTEITLKANASDCTFEWKDMGETDPVITVDVPALYVVYATSTVNGCVGEAQKRIDSSESNPTIKVEPTHSLCSPDEYDVKDALVYALCDEVKYYSDEALTQEITDTKVSQLGTTVIYLQGGNSDGCVSKVESVEVTISELEVEISPDDAVCLGSSTVIWGKGTGSQAADYKLELSQGGQVIESAVGKDIKHTVQPEAKTEYVLTASNGACMSKLSTMVDVRPLPVIDFNRTGVYTFEVVQKSVGAEPYTYSLGGGAPQTDKNFTVDEFGEYTVLTTDAYGCKSETDILLEKVLVPIDIPPFFSPNGDGVNDLWHIKNIEYYPDAVIEIYDRYHKLLVRFKGDNQYWDGEYNGHAMPSTDYWYYIRDNDLHVLTGHFLLKR